MWSEFLIVCYSIIVIACLMIFIALLERRPLRVRAGLVMLPACALLSFGSIIQTILPNFTTLLAFYYLNTLMFVVIITSFIFFVGEFTGRFDPYRRINLVIILAMPVMVTVSVLSDPWLHFYNASYALTSVPDYEIPFLIFELSWMNYIWSAYCYVSGLIIMYILAVRLYEEKTKDMFSIFVAGVGFCLVLNIGSLYITNLKIMPVDGLSFTVAALFFYTAALVFGVFDITPVARKKMLDVMEDAIYVLDSQGMVSDVNTAGLDLIRMVRSDLLRKRPEGIMSKFPELARLIDEPGAHPNMEVVDDDGRFFAVKLIPFEYGRIGQKGQMLVIHDVTERKLVEERIRVAETQMKMAEADRRYKTLVDNQTEAIITYDGEGRITFGNPVFEQIMNRSGKGLVGANIKDIVSSEDDAIMWALVDKVTPNVPEFHFEHVITLTDGSDLWIHWQGKVLFDRNGSLKEVQAAGINITEKKRSEAEYQAIVECLKEMIVRRTREGRISFVNQAFSGFFQVPIVDLIGSNFFPPADDADITTFMEAISSLTPEMPDRDFLLLRVFLKDDVTRSTEWKVRGIFDSRSRLVEYQCVGNDITERLKMEQELIKTQKLESIGVLAGGIAHDFNNLLSSVVSNIEVATTEIPMGERSRHRLDEAVRSAMSARHLTQQLLTFSMGGKPVKEPIDVASLLRTNIEFTLTGSKVKAEYLISDHLRHISADPFQMSQVINNLVINAVQAMPEGGKITIKASNVDTLEGTRGPVGGYGHIKIAIIDHGIGIPAGNLSKIFDPFFTTKEKGTGLGLSTVQSIVKNHHGLIDVESNQVGTVFTLYLPACEPVMMVVPDRVRDGVRAGEARILIMDDEESILDVLSVILSEIGHDVELARTGEDAIGSVSKAMSEGRPFDLLIMDLTIRGGMGGKDAIIEILKLDPNIKAIVSSGYSNDPVMSDPEKYGFSDVLQKPYTIQDLREKLSIVLDKDRDHAVVLRAVR